MLTFIKLGGSLITDKREAQHFHAEVMGRAAQEIARAQQDIPHLRLLIGHGGGSYGHVAAQKYGTAKGVQSPEQWRGYAEVALMMQRLNRLVMDTLYEAHLPVMAFPPSASVRCENGEIKELAIEPIRTALERGVVPVVFGDVALDSQRGGTIVSTETVFFYLAERLRPTQILLLGEVEGVYDAQGSVIPHITPRNLEGIATALGGSHGTDVTGGMASKVRQMVSLAERLPGMEIRIFGGTVPGQIEAVLAGRAEAGTRITD